MPGIKVASLSTAAIRQFRDLARHGGRLDPAGLRSAKATLIEKLQLTEGTYLNRAAVLLFHEDPEKFVTGAFMKVGFVRSASDLAYHDMIQGDLFTQVAKTIDLVNCTVALPGQPFYSTRFPSACGSSRKKRRR